jgi:hypothetical protein
MTYLSTTETNDTRDLAEYLLDGDTPEADRRAISSLFEDFGIDADSPDDIDVTIIPQHLFVEHCKELLQDCGYIPTDMPDWIEIDWEATSQNMAMDYIVSSVEIDGYEVYFLFRG